MSNLDENEMRRRAEKWLDLDDKTARPVTRENALAEDMMALDVLDLLAEVEQLRAERDTWSGKACEEEQQAGCGPCGACRYCLPGMLKEARAEAARYLADGKALHREIEKVALTLNEIGWPSENASATERACRALRALAADRDAYRKAKQENDERFMIERDEARAECERLRTSAALCRANVSLHQKHIERLRKLVSEACDWADGTGDKLRPHGLTPADEERIATIRRDAAEAKGTP